MVKDSTKKESDQLLEMRGTRESSGSVRIEKLPFADRRSFLTLVGAAVGAGAVGSVAAEDEEDENGENGQSEDDTETEQPPGTDALFGYIEALYGDRLDAEQREEVTAQIAGSLESAAAIGEVELENGDEPAFRFQAYRGEESW